MSDHTIKRTRGADRGIEPPFKDAGVAITPGELLEIAADGDLEPHGTADANALPIFALEDPNREAAAGVKQIDTDYPADDSVRWYIAATGDLVYAFLAAGENVAEGAALSSDGAGALQAVTASAATSEAQRDGIVGYAAEDVDNSGGGSRVRILVRVR